MDVGAMTVFLYCYEEREKIHNFYEQLTGARFTSSYTRIGGQTRDVPNEMLKEVLVFCDEAAKPSMKRKPSCSKTKSSLTVFRA